MSWFESTESVQLTYPGQCKKLEILPQAQKLMSTESDADNSEKPEGYDGNQRQSMEELIEQQEGTQNIETPGAGNE